MKNINILQIIKKIPGTIILVSVALIVSILTKSLWESASSTGIIDKYGYGIPAFADGQWWTILTGAFIPPEPWMMIVILTGLIIGCGLIEYYFGTIKMLTVIVVTHVLSILITALILVVFREFNIVWAVELAKVRDVGISNAAFGAMGAASAILPVVWRGRFRLVVLLYCITFILYSGVIWDLTHLVGFIIGLLLGPWVAGRALTKEEFPIFNIKPRALIAGLVAFGTYASVVAKVFPGNGGLINFDQIDNYSASSLLVLVTTTIMTIFIFGLYKGKKIAWIFVLLLSFLGLIGAIFLEESAQKWFDIVYNALLVILLFKYKNMFLVKSDKFTKKKILYWAIGGAVGVILVHSLLLYSFRFALQPKPSFLQVVNESLFQTVGLSTGSFTATNSAVKLLLNSIEVFWAIYLLALLVAIMLSTFRIRNNQGFSIYDKLYRTSKANSIGWMARWQGVSYWVSESEKAVFPYRLINNVAIVFSDPVGTQQAILANMNDFHNFCKNNGWEVCYFSVSEKMALLLSKRKFETIIIGEDTIILLNNLEFAGKKWQSIRSAINRANKQNIIMKTIQYSQAPTGLKVQMKDIANSWVKDKSLPEMGFTLGTLEEAKDDEVIMNIAVDDNGTVHGMTSWLPVYEKGQLVGRTLDIMQRSLEPGTMSGVIEYLIAESAMQFKDQGLKYASLSAAPLSNSKTQKSGLDKMLQFVADKMEPLYGFKSLHNFKEKFNPTHRQLYLAYEDPAGLPAITLAISRAYMNDQSYTSIIKNMLLKKKN